MAYIGVFIVATFAATFVIIITTSIVNIVSAIYSLLIPDSFPPFFFSCNSTFLEMEILVVLALVVVTELKTTLFFFFFFVDIPFVVAIIIIIMHS